MRLDHLLSKEAVRSSEREEVGAALLFRCEGSAGARTGTSKKLPMAVCKAHHHVGEYNLIIPVAVRKAHHHVGEYKLIIPVVMRLGETPVPIPNTKVKT